MAMDNYHDATSVTGTIIFISLEENNECLVVLADDMETNHVTKYSKEDGFPEAEDRVFLGNNESTCRALRNFQETGMKKIQLGLWDGVNSHKGQEYRTIWTMALEGERVCGGVRYDSYLSDKEENPLDGCYEPAPRNPTF